MKKNVYKNKKPALLFALITTLVAVGILIYLTLHFYDVKFGLSLGDSICNVSEKLNCDAVSASSYASFLSIPMALWGVVTYLVLAYLIFVSYYNLVEDKTKTLRYALMLSGFALITSLIMGFVSFAIISYFCTFCMLVYIASFLIFAAIVYAADEVSTPALVKDFKEIFTTQRWILGFAIAIPVVAFTANLMYLESKGLADLEKYANEKAAYWTHAPVETFDPNIGLSKQSSNEPAIMTIVEFADFRCGHCKVAAPVLHNFAKKYKDVKLIYKPFPLDGTCNEAMKGGGDGISCGLVFATFCSEKLANKGWQAHDYIFENQDNIVRAMSLEKNLEEIAKAVEIDLETLKACTKDPEIISQVKASAKEAEVAKVQGTPAIFINGKILSGAQSAPILEAVYRKIKQAN